MKILHDKRIAFIIGCALILAVSLILPSISVNNRPETNAEQTAAADTSYTLGEFDGKLAVFKTGNAEPIEIYDIYIANLPEPDRKLLIEKSLTTSSKGQLLLWIEDYIS